MKIVLGDLEANGLLEQATVVHCGVFKEKGSKELIKFSPLSGGDYVKGLLEYLDSVDVLIMHNGIGYDLPLLEKLYGYKYKGRIVDTLVMSRLQSPHRPRPYFMEGKGGPHSLAAWGYRVGRGKPDHDDWENFSPAMLHRCSEDVEILDLVYNALVDEAKGLGGEWGPAYRNSFKLFSILSKQERYGWYVDQKFLDKSLYMLNHWMDRIDKVLEPRLPMICEPLEGKEKGEYKWVKKPFMKSGDHAEIAKKHYGDEVAVVGGVFSRVAFRPVSLDSNAEVKAFLLKLGWEPVQWNTNEAGEQTSPKLSKDDPFEGVQGSMGRLIARRVQCKSRRSIVEGWKNKIREDGRLPSVVSGLADTGRATHSVIVNVPNADAFFGKWMRKIFSCPEGRVLVGCDAKGCQDRMLAQRAKNDDFTYMLLHGKKEDGTDGHSLATKAVNFVMKRHEMPLIIRSKGKNFNFGWKFGASDTKLGRMVVASDVIGAEIRKELEGVFPAQAELVERLTQEWKNNAQKVKGPNGWTRYKNGWIRGLDGRPIFIESEHAILVYVLQSDEAIMMANAYTMLYDKLTELGLEWGKDWAYVCWMHDEYNIECREELAKVIAPIAEQCIHEAGNMFGLTYCPQQGEASIGRNWYEIH